MYIYGKNVAYEKLSSNDKINRIIISNKFNDSRILELIQKRNTNPKVLENRELDKICKGLHQGIILDIPDIKTYEYKEVVPNIKNKYPLIIILDHIEDPHNFGAIIRTSEALGVDAIIIPKDRAVQITSTVVKTSVGAIQNMKIVTVANLNNTIKELKKDGYWIVGTDMEGTDYTDIDYKTKIALVIGNEGKGISKLVSENCDYLAKIPMKGKVNSLNASVACGIFISEVVRSRRS